MELSDLIIAKARCIFNTFEQKQLQLPMIFCILPSPISLVNLFREPVEIIAPNKTNTNINGLIIPNAAIESTPKHCPIITPSIS